ncbi:Head domain of trimeric autotransporter adhesin [Nonlabens sp. Hel1_33_55]|uniref:hypothetical protein n=1 Tax=Nonlabens sp. Hel1_33_55 TaxID=1336802 RepID=UPI000875AACB|nr:hypothetical protein [Nonlabens sp. Hel1_33_55]SCY23262.1 Head domain of trimeric autotransporter adhesin [Nonlabens sp. Hel1_33_55]
MNSSTTAANAIAVGNTAQAQASNSVAIGQLATATQENTIILGDNSAVSPSVNVGIGTNSPTAKLQINGTLRFVDSSPGDDNGKVLTADANGNATWQDSGSNRAFGEIYRDTDLTPTTGGNFAISSMIHETNTLQNITAHPESLQVSTSGVYKVSYAATLISTTLLDRNIQMFIAAGSTIASATILNRSIGYAGTSNDGVSSHVAKTTLVRLNAGDMVYLGYNTSNSSIRLRANTISLLIEKVD